MPPRGICTPVMNRILSKIKKDKKTKCWNFTGATDSGGYGLISRKDKMISIHRYVYWYYFIKPLGTMWKEFSENNKDLDVCHHCDNPPCCNPKHLFLGTRSTNIQDCVKKGRLIIPVNRGEEQANHKLTENQVLKIYNMKGTLKEIADKFGVCFQSISYIKTGRNWGWLTKRNTMKKG